LEQLAERFEIVTIKVTPLICMNLQWAAKIRNKLVVEGPHNPFSSLVWQWQTGNPLGKLISDH
jgi:hypothetical protein